MLKQFAGTNVEKVAKMTGLTDDVIRSISGMKVTSVPFEKAGHGIKQEQSDVFNGSFFSKGFSGLDLWQASPNDIMANTRMGYIELPFPFVNIEYTRGHMPVLPKLLHMSRNDLGDLVYFRKGITIKDFSNGEKKYHAGELIDLPQESDTKLVATGADAILFLMQEYKVDVPGAVISCVPVLPVSFLCEFRYPKTQEEKDLSDDRRTRNVVPSMLGASYISLLSKIEEMKELFRHKHDMEKRDFLKKKNKQAYSIQRAMDVLIRNGAYGNIRVAKNGETYTDLAHVYRKITATDARHFSSLRVPYMDKKKLEEAYIGYIQCLEQMESGRNSGIPDKENNMCKELNIRKKAIIMQLRPLAEAAVDAYFADSKVPKNRLVRCALYNYESAEPTIVDSGFRYALVNNLFDSEECQIKEGLVPFVYLAYCMAIRMTYYLDNGISFVGDEREEV